MNIKSIYIFLLLLLSFFNFSGQTISVNKAELFNETTLLQNLKIISSDLYEGRRTGTEGALRAKKYIINQFYKLNVSPLGKSFEQPFLFNSKIVLSAAIPLPITIIRLLLIISRLLS